VRDAVWVIQRFHHHHRVGAKRSGAIWGESHWLVTFLLLKRHCAIQLESVFKNCLYFKNITPKGCATLFGSSKGSSSQQGQKKWSDLETKFIHQLHDLHFIAAAAAAAAAAAKAPAGAYCYLSNSSLAMLAMPPPAQHL
jgi:hypothetical protein